MLPARLLDDLDVAERHRAEGDHVVVVQLGVLDAAAIHERPGSAAVVPEQDALAPADDQRVTPRHALLLDPDIGGEATPDVGHAAFQGDQQTRLAAVERQV